MNLRDIKGVTLTELMIVLSIIAITAAIVIPMYTADLPRQKAKAAAQQMLTDLRLARARAVANNQAYLICFNTDGYTLTPQAGGPTDCDAAAANLRKTVDFIKSFSGVKFQVGTIGGACPGMTTTQAIAFPSEVARFTRLGSSVDGSDNSVDGVVYLTNTQDPKQQTYCVQVEGTTGRAKLYRWDTADGWK